MRNIKLFILPLSLTTLLFIACGGGNDSGPDPEPEKEVPSAATLIAPEKDAKCNEGEVVSHSESDVTFQWNASEHTDSYTVSVKNLNTGKVENVNTFQTSKVIRLARGVPYSWKVISRADGVPDTSESGTWKLYNAGPGVQNYAPFPAEFVAPEMGGTVQADITLKWTGSDVDGDGDIKEFSIYLGKENPPKQLVGTTNQSSLEVSLGPGTVYFWKVVTLDNHGASSESPVFNFKTE